jgi:hypothetical protein
VADWINHVVIAAPRNGTTSHTVAADGTGGTVIGGTAFTPTAGRLLKSSCYGGITSGSNTAVPTAPPTGWTAPTNNQAVNNGGLYVWKRIASATSADQLVLTHNASNYPILVEFWEYAAGSDINTMAFAVSVANGATGPALSSQTGVHTFSAYGGVDYISGSTGGGNPSFATGLVTSTFLNAGGSPVTDGYEYAFADSEGSAAASYSDAFTWTGAPGGGAPTVERLVEAMTVVAATTPLDGAYLRQDSTSKWLRQDLSGAWIGQSYVFTGNNYAAAAAVSVTSGVAVDASAVHPVSAVVPSLSAAVASGMTAVHPASAITPTLSTVLADAVAVHPASAAVAALSGVTANPIGVHPAAAVTPVLSAVLADAAVIRLLAAVTPVVSTTLADAQAVHPASATVPSSSAVLADAAAVHPVSAATLVTSGVSVSAGAIHPVSITVAALTGVLANPVAVHPVSAVTPVISAVLADVMGSGGLYVTIPVSSGVSASGMTANHPATAVTPVVSGGSAAAPTADHPADVVTPILSAVVVSGMTARHSVSLASDVVSSVIASGMTAAHPAAAVTPVISGVIANLTSPGLGVTIPVHSAVVLGTVAAQHPAVARVDAVSDSSADPVGVHAVAARVDALSGVIAALTGDTSLRIVIPVVSTFTVFVRAFLPANDPGLILVLPDPLLTLDLPDPSLTLALPDPRLEIQP